MCGIVGYIGEDQATPILLDGLQKLEYRGYDSAGIAVYSQDHNLAEEKRIRIIKSVGRLQNLSVKIDQQNGLLGTAGIGHTRWATHGEPSEKNAHPLTSDDHLVVGVHNGIIENFREIRQELEQAGYSFYSETDTEVGIKLIHKLYEEAGHDPLQAMKGMVAKVRGSYALAVLFSDRPNEIWVSRKDSPMILGKEQEGSYLGSDVPALLNYTRNVYYIKDREIACLKRGDIQVYDAEGEPVDVEYKHIDWDAQAAEKGGYDHFMLKEIHEQPTALRKTLGAYVKEGHVDFHEDLPDELLKKVERIHFVACGSAYHVGMVARYVLEKLARVPVLCDVASEFRYRDPILQENDLVVIVSQSGETADSLAALRKAKEGGVKTLALVNAVGSTISREADYVLYTLAGPEIAVATTKAYSTQLLICDLLAVHLGVLRGQLSEQEEGRLLQALEKLPEQMEELLKDPSPEQELANRFVDAQSMFFIGRGIDYAASLEASLKLKEVSYIHSEAYPAGELKHGTISLIEDGTLVIGLMTQPDLLEKTRSNLVEVKTRGAFVCGVSYRGSEELDRIADCLLCIPKTEPIFATSLLIVPLQLFAYYISVGKGLDVDKPRNLAKSVTVE